MKLLKYRDKELILPAAQNGVSGHFRLEVLKNGHVVREREFDNLITDLGMERLQASNSPNGVLSYCHAGTGTVAPAFTDAALAAFTAASGSPSWTQSVVTSTPKYGQTVLVYNFAVGALNGNYTEVGISSLNTTGGLFSRALILDGGGTPTSLSIASDEQLRVTYTLRFYVNEADVVDPAVVITGAPDTPYSVTLRRTNLNDAPANSAGQFNDGFFLALTSNYGAVRAYDGTLGSATSNVPNGANLGNATTITMGSYTSGVYQRDTTFTWSPAAGNGSIKSLRLNHWSAEWQAEFDVAIVKSSLFSFTYTHRVILARV